MSGLGSLPAAHGTGRAVESGGATDVLELLDLCNAAKFSIMCMRVSLYKYVTWVWVSVEAGLKAAVRCLT